jgi:hypothetical protein
LPEIQPKPAKTKNKDIKIKFSEKNDDYWKEKIENSKITTKRGSTHIPEVMDPEEVVTLN